MTRELNFYQVENLIENGIAKTIAPLLLKILEENKKILIYSKDTALINSLDNGLWSFGKNKFIPHITIFDQEFQQQNLPSTKQPIIITNQEQNDNIADYLLLLDKASAAFVSSFSRIFYFSDSSKIELVKDIKASYQKIIDAFNFYKKDLASQKWIRTEIN